MPSRAQRILVVGVGVSVPSEGTWPVSDDDASQDNGDDSTNTGSSQIVITAEHCPAGVTADEALDHSAGDPCFGGEQMIGMTVTVRNLDTGETSSVEVADVGSTSNFPGLPAGSYAVSFDAGDQFGETVGFCGGQDSSADLPVMPFTGSGVDLDLPAGREYWCVTSTLSLGDDSGSDGGEDFTGTFYATFYACSDGMTFDSLDTSQCEVITDGFAFGFDGDVKLNLGDASPSGNGYVWSGLDAVDGDGDEVMWTYSVGAYPDGYDWFAVSANGGPVLAPHAGGFTFTSDQQKHTLDVYFIQH